jgi:hypothetical protein
MEVSKVSALLCVREGAWGGGRYLLTPPSLSSDKQESCVYTEGGVRGET